MQNKANFPNEQMNVNVLYTKDYENISNCKLCENKANSKPNKANLPDDQMNVSSFLTKEYENISNCKLCENKANTKPKQTQSNPISPPPATKQNQFKPNTNPIKPNPPAHKSRRFDCCLALDLPVFCFSHNSLNFHSYCRNSCDIGFDAKQFLEKHAQYDWLKGYLKDLQSLGYTGPAYIHKQIISTSPLLFVVIGFNRRDCYTKYFSFTDIGLLDIHRNLHSCRDNLECRSEGSIGVLDLTCEYGWTIV